MSIEKLRAQLKEQHRAETAFGNVRAARKIVAEELRDLHDPALGKVVSSLSRCGARDRGVNKNRYDCNRPICPVCRQRDAIRYTRKVREAVAGGSHLEFLHCTVILAAGTDPLLVAQEMDREHRRLKHLFASRFPLAKVFGSREFDVIGADQAGSLSASKKALLKQLNAFSTPQKAIYVGHIHFLVDLDGSPDFAVRNGLHALFPGPRRVLCQKLRSKRAILAQVERLLLYQNKLSMTRKYVGGNRCWLEPSEMVTLLGAITALGKRWLRFELGTQPQKRRTSHLNSKFLHQRGRSSRGRRVANRVTTTTSKKILSQTTGLKGLMLAIEQINATLPKAKEPRKSTELLAPQDYVVCWSQIKTSQNCQIPLANLDQNDVSPVPWLPPAIRKGVYNTKFVCEDVSDVRRRSVPKAPDPMPKQTLLNLGHNMRRYWLVLGNMNTVQNPDVMRRSFDLQATQLDEALRRCIRYKEGATTGGSFQNLAFEAVSKRGGGFRH